MKKIVYIFLCLFCACSSPQSIENQTKTTVKTPSMTVANEADEKEIKQQAPTLPPANEDSLYFETLHDTAMIDLSKYDKDFIMDIKYATADNFTKQVLYDCPRGFLRKKVAKDLLNAYKEFKKLGYKIRIFDVYRPHAVQFKMWDLTPDKKYVGNPHKGSMHNRGCAVDLTLVGADGKDLDMGTAFDFFGKEAHITYKKFSKEVLKNRQIFKEVLEKNGFRALQTEWWHFSYNRNVYNILDEPIPCDEKVIVLGLICTN